MLMLPVSSRGLGLAPSESQRWPFVHREGYQNITYHQHHNLGWRGRGKFYRVLRHGGTGCCGGAQRRRWPLHAGANRALGPIHTRKSCYYMHAVPCSRVAALVSARGPA
jgi:hypothetical protein